MSDDFDQDDDLAWLQGADDEDDEPGDEDEKFDWQQQSPEQGPASAGNRLGFTTQLPWMGGDTSDSGRADDEEEQDYTWLQSADTADAINEEFELDWLLEPGEEPPPREPEEQPGWLKRRTEELSAVNPEDIPKWLEKSDSGADEIGVEDVPEWLRDSLPPAREVSMLDDTGQLSADWLAKGAELPDTVESEKTFDEWMVEQAEAERVPDLEEQMPDLSGLEEPVDPAKIDTGALPDWFLGMEELDVEDAPDWFAGERPGTGSLGDSAIQDWLASQQPPEPEPPAPQPVAQSPLGEDFFASLGDETRTEEETAFGEDYFAALGTDAQPTLDDVLAALGNEQPEPPDSGLLGEDFFAELTRDSASEFPAITQSAGEPDMLGEDFFASLDQPSIGEPDTIGEDFFASPGMDQPRPDEEFFSALEAAGDLNINAVPDGQLLQSLGIEAPEETEEQFDWFALEEREPEDVTDLDSADWLQDLGALDEAALAAAEPDFGEFEAEPLPDLDAPGLDDIDDLLASMGGNIMALPDTGHLLSDDVDFDTLFSDPAFSDIASPAAEKRPGELQPDSDDLLSELGATVGGVSAAAMLRQRDDRPLEELPDRLKRLRDRGASTSARTAEPDALTFVPDIREAAETIAAPVRGTAEIILSPEQQRRVDVLKQLAASEQATAAISTRAISDEPFLLDEDERMPEQEGEAAAPAQRRLRFKVDRLLIALAVAAAVIVPFVANVRIGDLPPSAFAAGSREQIAFEGLDQLQPGDRVLFGMEYGPTAAPELDGMARVLLQHVLMRGAQPVVVSSNPVALLRADNILTDLSRNTALQANDDYYVARFISGGAIGLRGLAANPAAALGNDLNSQPTGLAVTGLGDFARVVVIAERPDDLRAWAEQIAPQTGAPLLAATGYAGEPLIEPYMGSGIAGLLIGFKDAYTYEAMLMGSQPAQLPLMEAETEAPTPEPTQVPVSEVTAEASPETPESGATQATAEPSEVPATATTAPTEGVAATSTPQASPTTAPSATPRPATATPEPTETAVPTETPPPTATPVPSATPQTEVVARVIAQETINVRGGPNTTFGPVGTASPGDEFVVLGRNADGSWIQIDYPDLLAGQEAWVAAFLVEITVREVPAEQESSALVIVMAGSDMSLSRLLAQDATPTAEEAATVLESTASAPATSSTLAQSERRWYAMNLGLVVIIVVIVFGTLVNIGRALLRRGK